jgi:hypothetical protein
MNRAELSNFRAEIKKQLEREMEARGERQRQFNLALIKTDSKSARRMLTLVYYDIMCEAFNDEIAELDEFRDGAEEIDDDIE